MKILLTTTSYQDTPGKHHDLLQASGFDVVRARGPLQEADMLKLINDFSAMLADIRKDPSRYTRGLVNLKVF